MAKAHIPSGDENGLLSSILAADLPTSKNIIREPRLNAWWYNLEGKTDETSNNPDLLIANNQEHLLPNAQESIQENVCESAEFEIDEEFEVGLV